MKALSMVKLLTCIVLFAGILLVTACGGITIAPDGNGGVTVTPNENGNSGNSGNSGNTDSGNNGDNSGNSGTNDEVHSHVYELVESDRTSSCTEDVVRIWKCECGSEFKETFAAPGHDIRSYEGKAATCTEDGYKPYEKCIRGDCEYTTYESIPAIGHDLEYFADIQPTCTEKGAYDRAQCKTDGCGYSTENVIAALGHIRQIVDGKPATCTEDGYLSYEICTRSGCDGTGIEEPVVIKALGHDDVHYEAKEPTCTEFGWNAYDVCHRCSRSTYEKIEAKGHTYENGFCACGSIDLGLHTHIWNDGEIILKPTCTTTGMITYTCTDENCGDTKTDEIPALGHNNKSFDAKAPTCTVDGWHAYEECDRCGYSTYSVDPALGHSYDNGTVTTKPTCTETGVRTFSCVRGDHSFNVEEEALGHDFGAWTVVVEPKCDAWGQEQRICSHDNSHVETKSLSMLGHDYGDEFVYIEPTCTKNGETRKVCKNDSSHIITTVIPALGHKGVDNTTGICPVCNEVVKLPLATPEVSHKEGSTVYWGMVEGAEYYQVYIANSGNTIETTSTYVNLEDYYGTNTELQLYIKAIAPVNGNNINSANLQYIFTIPVGNISKYNGLGQSVNLLTGTYTNYANGTVSIFNNVLWNRLDAKENSIKTHDTDVLYSESIEDYTNQLTTSISNKMSVKGSAGIGKIAKVTAGYSFEVGANYSKKTYNQTQAIFYDMNYVYQGYQAGIDGYNNPDMLRAALSEEFLADALDLQNGRISPEQFIGKYGTHVITSGIYGASFKAHFERLMNKSDVNDTFGANIKQSISSGISAAIKGIDVGVDKENTFAADISVFTSETSSDIQSKFTINAVGGNAASNMVVSSLADFSTVCESWANSIENESSFMLIDVPDGSLYFVWDFLGDEYAEAKDILNGYFYSRCDEQYKSINSKISSVYQDFFVFDSETGTLTIDWSARQTYTQADLSNTNYTVNGTTMFDYVDSGIFTVYSAFNGQEVKKVVFKGSYRTPDSLNQIIENRFINFGIKFDKHWSNDIVIEFKNFAFEAQAGQVALDFSEVSSNNITIISNGNVYIKGGNGNGYGSTGSIGINADGKNLVIEGSGALEVVGGNGSTGKVGSPDDKDGEDGGNGKAGGNGCCAIKAASIVITNSSVTVVGGNGGNGGRGGHGNSNFWNVCDGGNGGKGGTGANALIADSVTAKDTTLVLIGGNGGNGGRGGNCGKYGPNGDVGSGGSGGSGAVAINIDVISDNSLVEIIDGYNGSKGAKGT